MTNKFAQALDDCLKQLKRGRTIKECLGAYPELKEKLRPYLETAFEIKENVPLITPSEDFQKISKERILAKIQEQVVTKPAVSRYSLWKQYISGQNLIPRIALVILIICGLLAIGGYAAAKSLPDSPLYPLKKAVENTQLFLTLDPVNKASLHLAFAEKRIAETKAMIEKDKSDIAVRVLAEYEEQLGKTMAQTAEAKEKGLDVEEVMAKVSEATLKHQEVLADVYEKVPEQAQEAIENAIEKSMKGHEEALKAISGEKKEEMEKKGKETRTKVEEKLKKKVTPEIPKALEKPEAPELQQRSR